MGCARRCTNASARGSAAGGKAMPHRAPVLELPTDPRAVTAMRPGVRPELPKHSSCQVSIIVSVHPAFDLSVADKTERQ